MKKQLEKASSFFAISLDLRSRVLVLIAALALIPTFFLSLWNMTLYSNQFPDGLLLNIYSYKLEGGKTAYRDDLKEINSLNHYIGMRALKDEDFTEFKWIPFVIGAIVLLAFRVLVQGKMSQLVDLLVMFCYFGLFSLWSFYHKLYLYGHDLDPEAAINIPPFTPPLFGHHTLANFEVYSYPGPGSYFMAIVPLILIAAIWISKKNREKERKLEPA